MIRRTIALTIALAVWSSCNAAPAKLTPEKLRSLGTIAVISLMGDEFLLHHVGTTIFQNRYNRAEVSGWEIDKYATEVATEFLESKGHTIKEVQYDIETLFKTYPAGWARAGRKFKKIRPSLQELAKQSSIDTFVILYRHFTEDFITFSAEGLSGYGLYHRRAFKKHAETATYVVIRIDVASATSKKPLASTVGSDSNILDEEYWHKPYQKKKEKNFIPLAENQIDTLRRTTKINFRNAIGEALARMDF